MKTENLQALEAEITEVEKLISERLTRLATMVPLTSISITVQTVASRQRTSTSPSVTASIGLEYRWADA